MPCDPGGTLSDYVPFYFTPLSPMLLNIGSGWRGMKKTPMQEIVVLSTSVHRVASTGARVLIADRHAYLVAANFSENLHSVYGLDWARLQEADFQHRPEDPERFERYQAEALVYRSLPIGAIDRVVCYGHQEERDLRAEVARRGMDLKVEANREWFF